MDIDYENLINYDRHSINALIYYGTGVHCEVVAEYDIDLPDGPRFTLSFKVKLDPEYAPQTKASNFYNRHHVIYNNLYHLSPMVAAAMFVKDYLAWLAAGEPLEEVSPDKPVKRVKRGWPAEYCRKDGSLDISLFTLDSPFWTERESKEPRWAGSK